MPVRAGIYTRIELNAKGEMVSDPAKQEETCRRHAQRQGYVVTQVYREDNVGFEAERTELRSLRTAIWKRNIDVLLATKPDRLYADANRLARFVKEADLMSVRLEFVEASLDGEYWLRDTY
jgi:DNA invertase Pin-like site-specific DNA recombinase